MHDVDSVLMLYKQRHQPTSKGCRLLVPSLSATTRRDSPCGCCCFSASLPNSPTSHRVLGGWQIGQATEQGPPVPTCAWHARQREALEVLRLFTTVNHLLPPRTGGLRDPGSVLWGLHKKRGGGGDDRLDKGVCCGVYVCVCGWAQERQGHEAGVRGLGLCCCVRCESVPGD